jgi:hypothetical protein
MDFVQIEQRWQEENPDEVGRNADGSLEEHFGYLRKWLVSEGYPLEDQPVIGKYILKDGDRFVCYYGHESPLVMEESGTAVSIGFGGPSAMGPSSKDVDAEGNWVNREWQYITIMCWPCYLDETGEDDE